MIPFSSEHGESPATSARASAPGSPAIHVTPSSTSVHSNSPGFFGSLKKKLNAEKVEDKDKDKDKSAEDDESQDDASEKDRHADDKSGGKDATKEAFEALSAETKQLLRDLEAEPVIRAILPMSRDYFITKKLRTYHHVFNGSEAVSWLEKVRVDSVFFLLSFEILFY